MALFTPLSAMRRRSVQVLAGAAFLLAALVHSPVEPHAQVFNPETFTLENGMQVVVITNQRVPVVQHMVWYKVGSADEKPGYSGIAHFLEHLMFKGTKTRAPGEFSEIIARNGGQENAFTSLDYTAYFQTIAKEHLEKMMELEADRMTNLTLTDEVIEPERQVVREERRSRVDNNPSSILQEQVSEVLYRNYPYRKPVIGYDHEIISMTRENIIDFYRQWYAPNNAILIVAGDITAEELKPLAEKYYGVIPAQPAIDRTRTIEPPHKASRTVELVHPRVRQAQWSRTYLAPGYVTGETKHSYALEVLSEIIGGGGSSRLYRALVIDNKIAVSAGAYYSARGLGPGSFGFYGSPQQGVSLEDMQAAVDAEIKKVLEDGVTKDEVARAKKRMLAQAIYARDSFQSGARIFGVALTTGRTVEDVESWPQRIEAVTTEQILEAARAVLQDQPSVTSKLLPVGYKDTQG